jgi:sn-glycerol 3-phosphate transport system permease protein
MACAASLIIGGCMEYRPIYKHRFTPWLLLFPTFLVLIIFLYYPALQSIILSLYRSNLFLGTRKFIGFENYENLFTGPLSPAFRQVFVQTIIFAFAVIFPGISISLIIAVQANKKIRGARFYRLLLIWPFALSPAVAGTIFLFMFNPEVGVINQVLDAVLGIKPRWLDTPVLAFVLVVLAAVWKNLGYNIVFYLAALQNVPTELNEASEIDGAGGIKRFFHITIPMVSHITFFLIFTNLVYSFFSAFALVDIVTKGGPVGPAPFDNAGLTTIFIYKIYQDGFGGSSNIGFAAAQGVLLMTIVAAFTVLQFKTAGDRVYYGGT